jgi:hypothetical protein
MKIIIKEGEKRRYQGITKKELKFAEKKHFDICNV